MLNGVAIVMNDVTDSATKDTGALIVEGGVGIEKSVNIGGNLKVLQVYQHLLVLVQLLVIYL